MYKPWYKFFQKDRYAIEIVKSPYEHYYFGNYDKNIIEGIEKELQPFINNIKESSYQIKPKKAAIRREYKCECVLKEEFGKLVFKKYMPSESINDYVDLNEVLYFDEIVQKRLRGIAFGGLSGGGQSNSIEIVGISKESINEIRQKIIDSGSKIGEKHVRIKHSLFPLLTPSRWFRKREMLLIAPFGLIHKFYDGKVRRSSVLPFSSIKSYNATGLLWKHITLLGSTTISTIEAFSCSCKRSIWRELKIRNIENDWGKEYHPCIFHRKEAGKLNVRLDSIIYKDRETNNTQVLMLNQIYYKNFEKKHFFSLTGTVEIKGRRLDARAGEGGDIHIKIPYVWFTKGKKLINSL